MQTVHMLGSSLQAYPPAHLQIAPTSGRIAAPDIVQAPDHTLVHGSRLNPKTPPRIELASAIMDESKLPSLPPASIHGVLRKGGKMVISGAPKSFKTFLAIQLGIAAATGASWLGFTCEPSPVVYANLEVDNAQFMKRVQEVAKGMMADPMTVEQNLQVTQTPRRSPSIEELVDGLIANSAARGCGIVVIDPMYKCFEGVENDQQSMAKFFGHIDRLIDSLGCSVVVIHHQSKGSQIWKSPADRAAGSGVLARDADALVSLVPIDHPGIAMRAEFVLRDYPEADPVNYCVRFPLCVVDESPSMKRAPVASTRSANKGQSRERALREVESACEKLLENNAFVPQREVCKALGNMKPQTLHKYLDTSKAYCYESGPNYCHVKRRN